MRDMFEGFWEATTDGTSPLLKKQELQSPKPEDVVAAQQADSREDKKKKDKYDEYVSAVEKYPEIKEEFEKAKSQYDYLSKDGKNAAMNEVNSKQHTIKQQSAEIQDKLRKLEEERNNEIALLRKQQTSSVSITGFKKPAVDEEIQDIILNAAEHKMMTGEQSAYVSQDIQTVCGSGQAIPDVKTMDKLEKMFVNSPYSDYLKNGLPSDEYVSKWLQRIATYSSIAMLVLLLLGGLKLGFVSSIINAIVYIIVWIVAGGVVAVLGVTMLRAMFKDHPTLCAIGGIVVGFFVIGSSIAASVSGWLSSQISGGSFFVGLIAGLILAGINWVAVYCLVSWLPVVKWLKKVPALKAKMMRGVFEELNKLETMKPILYCFVNHDQMCQFFEEEEILNNINGLKKMIARSESAIADMQQKLNAAGLESRQLARQGLSKEEQIMMEIRDQENKKRRLESELHVCENNIRSWNGQPKLEWIKDYVIRNKLCFEGISNQRAFTICQFGLTGLTVHYNIDVKTLRSDAQIGMVAKIIIDAFTKMNPSKMMEITVINMKNWLYSNYKAIDWKIEIPNSSGGKSKEVGDVYGVEDEEGLNSFMERVKANRSNRDGVERLFADDLKSIYEKNRSATSELCYVNQIQKEKNVDPIPYQIAIIYMDEKIYARKEVANLIEREVAAQGFVPVFLINEHGESYKGNQKDENSWDNLINRTNRIEL